MTQLFQEAITIGLRKRKLTELMSKLDRPFRNEILQKIVHESQRLRREYGQPRCSRNWGWRHLFEKEVLVEDLENFTETDFQGNDSIAEFLTRLIDEAERMLEKIGVA